MLHDLPILKKHYDFRAPRFSVSHYLNYYLLLSQTHKISKQDPHCSPVLELGRTTCPE